MKPRTLYAIAAAVVVATTAAAMIQNPAANAATLAGALVASFAPLALHLYRNNH